MRILRSMLAGCFFLLYGLGGLLAGFVLLPVLALCGARAPRFMRAAIRAAYRLFVAAGRLTGLFRVEIAPADRARLASARGCVVVANHLTLIDIVILISLLPDATAIAKAAAGRNFFYARVVNGMFLVNDDPARVTERACGLLAEGVSVVVFPEGTRTPADAPRRKLRRGAAQIALHAGVPILCVRLACDPPVLAKGQPWYEVGDRTVEWRLSVAGELPPRRVPAEGVHHAAAVALTAEIYGKLWP